MKCSDKKYEAYVQILKEELVPAMGCTEPIAIAYGAAVAKKYLEAIPDRVVIEASGNLIKNVKSVIVPNTCGMKGMPAAAAAGIIAGNPDRLLEVIADVKPEQKDEIKDYIEKHDIEVKLAGSKLTFDLTITEYKDKSYVKVRIVNYHTNIVEIEKDGKILYHEDIKGDSEVKLTDRSLLNIEDIVDFANTVDLKDVKEVIGRQIEYNSAIAEEGIKNNYGANIGKIMLKTYGNDIKIRAKAMAAAGSDARMNGCELPVVIVSGSGNQGMTASLPVIEFAKELKVSEEKLYRALVVSNLATIHQKTGIGRLSAFCGAVSAGCGSGAGICYLNGGGYTEIAHTIVNALAIVSGMVCDGAKASCAAKISSAVEAGILGYYMYKNGQEFKDGDGIISKGVENTIKNIGRLGHDGMKATDEEILHIMVGNRCV